MEQVLALENPIASLGYRIFKSQDSMPYLKTWGLRITVFHSNKYLCFQEIVLKIANFPGKTFAFIIKKNKAKKILSGFENFQQ